MTTGKPCPGCGIYMPGGYHAPTCPVEYPRTGPFTDHPTLTPSREGRTCKKHEQWCPNGLCRWCDDSPLPVVVEKGQIKEEVVKFMGIPIREEVELSVFEAVVMLGADWGPYD